MNKIVKVIEEPEKIKIVCDCGCTDIYYEKVIFTDEVEIYLICDKCRAKRIWRPSWD